MKPGVLPGGGTAGLARAPPWQPASAPSMTTSARRAGTRAALWTAMGAALRPDLGMAFLVLEAAGIAWIEASLVLGVLEIALHILARDELITVAPGIVVTVHAAIDPAIIEGFRLAGWRGPGIDPACALAAGGEGEKARRGQSGQAEIRSPTCRPHQTLPCPMGFRHCGPEPGRREARAWPGRGELTGNTL